MPQKILTQQARLILPVVFMLLAALACSLGGQPTVATATPAQTAEGTLVAQSDVPTVEIRSPQDKTEVVINTEVQVYARAVDKVGVTRIEMRVDGLIVDTAASPEANGVPSMDSILSWTPNSAGPHVVEVVAFRGNTRGNPTQITLTVRDDAAEVTNPAGSPSFLTASPTSNPTCRVRVATTSLNLRTGPGINYSAFSSLSIGSEIPVLGLNNDGSWYEVDAQGTVGWVSGAYVTQLGVCSTLQNVAIPPSPTVPVGASPFVFPATFTPLPTIPLPTPSSTIPIVVLPTLTWTPIPTAGQQQPSAGDLSSTAIFATQTQLAKPPTASGATLAPNTTATFTATPQLPNLVISSIETTGTTVVLDPVQKLATVPFIVKVDNTGDAPAPVFQVTINLPNGTRFGATTTAILQPKGEAELTIPVTFTVDGPQRVLAIADSGNVIVESNENDNVAFKDMSVVVATAQAPTATLTVTVQPTTAVPTQATTQAPTVTNTTGPTATNTPTATFTDTPAPGTTQPPAPTATDTPTPTATFTATTQPTTEVAVVPTNAFTATFTDTPVPASGTPLPPTATFTDTPVPPTAVPPTDTPIPPTATFTDTPIPPTAVPPTDTPVPPTATFTDTPVPPTAVPPTDTPVPPTATFTDTPVPPTAVPPTDTPVPPTAVPPTDTPVPPTAVPPTDTPIPPTAPSAPAIDFLNMPIVPDLNDPGVQGKIKQIYGAGQQNGVNTKDFRLVGDGTLRAATNIGDPTSNLAQTFAQLVPASQYFASGITGANSPSTGNFSSADILNNGKGAGACAGKSPLNCALEGKPVVVFISVGRVDAAGKVALDQFQTNVTTAVNTAISQGVIPVLVTITASDKQDAEVEAYNTVIYQVAQAQQIPLLNAYGARKDDPARIAANGTLSKPAKGKEADFSADGLKAGENFMNVQLLTLLDSLKNVLALP